MGLPQDSIAVALLFFNLGVEFGQLKVRGRGPNAAGGLFRTAMALRLTCPNSGNRLDVIAAYAIGTTAAF